MRQPVSSPPPLGRRIPGYGNRKADIMLVGEAGGAAEEQMGRPFVGKAGKETDRYCKQAGIDFLQTYRTNVCKYRPTTRAATGNVKPTAADIRRDEGELVHELETIRPTFVVAIGAVAARWLLGSTFSSMEAAHGFAYPAVNWRAVLGNRGSRAESRVRSTAGIGIDEADDVQQISRAAHFTVIPVYHPAAGLHSPDQQPSIYFDFQQLGKYVRGDLPCVVPRDMYPDPDYYEPANSVSLIQSLPIAIDTEGLAGRVWGLSYSQIPGSAGVIRATNRKALASFKHRLLSGER